MECSNGRIRAVVRSSRVPVGLAQFTMQVPRPVGLPTSTLVRSLMFADVLDEPQRRLLEDAKRLAQASCLELEVVDLGKRNLFRRAVSRLSNRMPPRPGLNLDLQSLADIQPAFDSSTR